ncbi:MAG: hypothetical protein MJE12_16165 [Alphaproteobacteria bacterium]|nr:hypothetical protein [Alphaproteobacteria bacterium]
MARSIDGGLEPTAHSAVQAMIVRAQQLADQSGKSVGLVYDLTKDEISLVDIADSDAAGLDFVRVLVPAEDGKDGAAEPAGDPFQQEFCFEL